MRITTRITDQGAEIIGDVAKLARGLLVSESTSSPSDLEAVLCYGNHESLGEYIESVLEKRTEDLKSNHVFIFDKKR